ncbi:hypothetical protein IKF40_00270 [Candidatus Saccharibacteria bacterium]|nr:hypothetical protein [Candidatus Saccharibacteria bacterium]
MSEQKTTTSAPSTNLKTTADIKKAKALATVVEKKRLQRESNERKNKISKLEENNDNCVHLYRSDKKWWRIIGHSVVYYAKIIVPRIRPEKNIRIWEDDDYNSPSKYGSIRIPSIEKCLNEAEQLGYQTLQTDDYAKICLKNKVTAEEFNRMVKEDDMLWEMLERSIQPSAIWPDLKAEILKLNDVVHRPVAVMDNKVSRVYGEPMDKLTVDMVLALNDAVVGLISPEQALARMMNDRWQLNGYMISVISMRLLTVKKVDQIAKQLEKVEAAIIHEQKRIDKVKRQKTEN